MNVKLLALTSLLALAPKAEAGTVIELILDASGSMNAPLNGSETRIAGARKAVESFLAALPPDAKIAFRVYGHQSPREKHDCNDTALVVPFSSAADAKAAITRALPSIQARGYTPITRVLGLAAKDFPPGSNRLIILVSDGKETCDGDPCSTARALRGEKEGVLIHTIGLGVDAATKSELQCIAKATGGSYFDATDATQLATSLALAAKTAAAIPPPAKDGRGTLKIENPGMNHDVVDSATGQKGGSITSAQKSLKLPSGVYNVSFGKQQWRGVEVENEKTTVLHPGVLEIEKITGSVTITDPESGDVLARLDAMNRRASLLPGTYSVRFGESELPFVRVASGEIVKVRTAVLIGKLTGLEHAEIRDAAGRKVASIDSVNRKAAVPAGEYELRSGKAKKRVSVKEGEEKEVSFP